MRGDDPEALGPAFRIGPNDGLQDHAKSLQSYGTPAEAQELQPGTLRPLRPCSYVRNQIGAPHPRTRRAQAGLFVTQL
jgi:hypothetical protein